MSPREEPVASAGETRRCLRALATDDADGETQDVFEEGEAALSSARRAAEFVDDGGDDRLRAAVADAVRAGDRDRVERGRRTLRVLHRFRRAASGDADGRRAADRASVPDERTGAAGHGDETTARAADEVHFHSARGTVLPRGGQRGDR